MVIDAHLHLRNTERLRCAWLRMQMYAWGQSCLEFVATGTAVRRLADEHRVPETSPRPTFTLGLDQ